MTVFAVVGAQYGSEAKGAVCAKLAWEGDIDIWVRTGGPNAGHTFYYDGIRHVLQSLPVGVIDPDASLVLGAGAVIDPGQLDEEYDRWRPRRLLIDQQATILLPVHRVIEGGTHGRAHRMIGSTGHGVGIARVSRMARNALGLMANDLPIVGMLANEAQQLGVLDSRYDLIDTGQYLRGASKRHAICLEGTQGSGLSLIHGPWPYVTSADTNAGQLLTDAGLPPKLHGCLLVVRTYPIRVAGDSGPLANETTWEAIGQEPEYTTVTKKRRRVGEFDAAQVRQAMALNGTRALAVTFLDYIDPDCRDREPSDSAMEWVANEVEAKTGGVAVMGGTGPASTWALQPASVHRWATHG